MKKFWIYTKTLKCIRSSLESEEKMFWSTDAIRFEDFPNGLDGYELFIKNEDNIVVKEFWDKDKDQHETYLPLSVITKEFNELERQVTEYAKEIDRLNTEINSLRSR